MRFGSGHRSGNSNRRGSNGVPLCPSHGLECLSLTANTPSNPGRQFYKCAHPTEADSCLKFVWADEFEGGNAGQRVLSCHAVTAYGGSGSLQAWRVWVLQGMVGV